VREYNCQVKHETRNNIIKIKCNKKYNNNKNMAMTQSGISTQSHVTGCTKEVFECLTRVST